MVATLSELFDMMKFNCNVMIKARTRALKEEQVSIILFSWSSNVHPYVRRI